jgi:S-adenosylmethionine decarboxylase
MQEHFGEHLMIDGYGGNEELLDDKLAVMGCLTQLPEILTMNTLAAPEVYRAEPNHIKDPGGWSGFVVIAESHISVHTFPKRGFLSADVYTCKNGLDTDTIVRYFKQKFELQDVEVNFVKRGTRFPAHDIYTHEEVK